MTVDTTPITSRPAQDGRSIASLIAEREKDPRKSAALARARKRIASIISDDKGLSLAQLRLSKGLSQQQLADSMQVKQPYIARIERGEDVRMSTVSALAKALGTSTAVVFTAIEATIAARRQDSE